MNNRLTKNTKLILDLMFYGGILVTASMYFIIRFYGQYNSYFRTHVMSLTVIFTLSGVLALLLVNELRKMFRSVIADDCFISENVSSLNKMGNYSFLIALVTSARLIIYITPAIIVVMIVFLIAGLFSKVLSQVFDKAVTYKQENDLTI